MAPAVPDDPLQPVTTVLLLSANPKNTDRLRLEEERREIEAGLMERSRLRDHFRLITKAAVRPRDVQRAMLDHTPQIVHFSGHGGGEPGLVLEDETGTSQFVKAEALAGLFELFADRLTCVVLNACYAAVQAEAIAQHIPYVIGMGDKITDRAAIIFAVAFYDALGSGRDVEFAYKLARNAIELAGIPEAHIPVLHRKPPVPPEIEPAPTPPAPSNPTDFHFSTYRPATFIGRDREIADLTPYLQRDCRILALIGMTGIGKTALAEKLAAEFAQPEIYYRVAFDLGDRSPTFLRGALTILQAMGDETAQQLSDEKILPHLLHTLEQRGCWLQLDSLEFLLTHTDQGQYHFTDPAWLDFFCQFLTRSRSGSSRLILTSQAIPTDLTDQCFRFDNLWHEYPLKGLEQEQHLNLFRSYGIHPQTPTETNHLCEIAHYFEGHPLILKMIAGDIQKRPFNGNVEKYWRDYYSQRQTQPHLKLHQSQEEKARNWVNQILQNLPDAPRQLLLHASVFQRPVPERFYREMLPDLPNGDAALTTLRDRNLIEDHDLQAGEWLLRQHNLIREVAYTSLKATPVTWEQAERQAAHLWLTAYQPAPDAPNLETVRGYLEAIDHYCAVKDWEKASEIYTFQLALTNQAFHWQLLIWGYYQNLLEISSRLVEHITSETKRICLNQIGNSYHSLGNIKKSIDYYQRALQFTRETSDRRGEGVALGSLGNAYYSLGQYERAIDFHQHCLTIAQEIGDRRSEGTALGSLGNTYYSLSQYERAIDFHQQRLTIAQEIGNRRGEGAALGSLGLAYDGLGQYERAIYFHQQYLTIAQEIGDRHGEGTVLGNLGNTYYSLGQYERAIDFHQQHFTIAQEIGDRRGESAALGSLGLAYYSLGQYERAIDFHQQALAISQEIGDRRGEGIDLENLGGTFIKLKRYSEALESLQKALEIDQEIGFRSGEAETLKKFAELHQALTEVEVAREYGQRALALAKELGIPLVAECEALLQQLQVALEQEE